MISEIKKENYAKLLEIANELSKIGWEIRNINFDRCSILVSKFFALITIYADTYERKISLSDENNKSCYRYCELSKNDDTTDTDSFDKNDVDYKSILKEIRLSSYIDEARQFYTTRQHFVEYSTKILSSPRQNYFSNNESIVTTAFHKGL